VQSASVQALYLNCGNELVVTVPQLGSSYSPSFSAKGGDAIKGSKTGEVTIIPTSTKVNLSVSSGGNFIGTESFEVKRIPQPNIKVYGQGGKEVNILQGEDLSKLRMIEIKAVPDESFAQFLPKDARYRVVDADIILARGSRPIDKAEMRDQKVNLNAFVAKGKSGDRIVIEVKKVQRMNFRNQVEDVNIGTQAFSINLK
jgi:gliding motility-associated protein GldM